MSTTGHTNFTRPTATIQVCARDTILTNVNLVNSDQTGLPEGSKTNSFDSVKAVTMPQMWDSTTAISKGATSENNTREARLTGTDRPEATRNMENRRRSSPQNLAMG